MLTVRRILETSLTVDDLERAIAWYQECLGLEKIASNYRFCALRVGEQQVLLLFKKGESRTPMPVDGGVIPPHDASGTSHVAFTVEDLDLWEQRLASRGVAIEGRVEWSGGSRSLYFRDPDGHLLELVTPGLWGIN